VFSLRDYSYKLPAERIAQKPAEQREQSRLLRLNRETGRITHHMFCEISGMLSPSDLLVINNTEVIPGRLLGKKATGGKVEVLILNYGDTESGAGRGNGQTILKCLIRASKPPGPGTMFFFEQGLHAELMTSEHGIHTLKFFHRDDFEETLYQIGKVPLPPYIRRNTDPPCADEERYQTVYASRKGAIAAPTAGLHFSEELLEKIKSGGVGIADITLHVGYGTFVPVRVSDIRKHRMHTEYYSISEKSADAINHAISSGSRVIAVGTTCVRTLEYAWNDAGHIPPGSGHCDIFIYPGYRFRAVRGMITNFHLPESTLLMLVSAFAGREHILNAYETAIRGKYRFYSYGDAMFID